MTIKGTPPQWFADIIISGIQRMYAILKFRPTNISTTTELWIDILWGLNITWDRERDSARLARGFDLLLAHTSEWSTPAEYMTYVPKREPQLALPKPEIPFAKQRENVARIKDLLKDLNKSKKMPH